MDRLKLTDKIENGKQVGVLGIIEHDGREFAYTYAIQKIKDKYVAYTEGYYLDEAYFYELEHNQFNEHIEVYESLPEVFEKFEHQYSILPEDMNTSRGNKFFWDNQIKLVRYTGETISLTLTHNKIYNVICTEKKWFRIVDDSGEDYLYPPEYFEKI